MAYIGIQPAESFTSFATQTFSVSATTSYTLDNAVANENELALFVNNVRQQPGSGKAYTASGTALTLSAATATTDTMYCIYLGRALQTVTPATNSITAAMIGDTAISGKDALTAEPADTDEFLVSDAGTLKRIDYSLIKGGGITGAHHWRITAAHSNMDNGDHVTSNWEQADSYGYGGIGTAMSQSSGIFTFPETGIWYVSYTCNGSDDNQAQLYVGGTITTTTDNSSYNIAVKGNTSIDNDNEYFTTTISYIFDVTSTSTHKVRFAVHCQNNGINLSGDTNRTDTGATFIRLGDT